MTFEANFASDANKYFDGKADYQLSGLWQFSQPPEIFNLPVNVSATNVIFVDPVSGALTYGPAGGGGGNPWLVGGQNLLPISLGVFGSLDASSITMQTNGNDMIILDELTQEVQIVSESFAVDVTNDVTINTGDGSIFIDSSPSVGQSISIGTLGTPLVSIGDDGNELDIVSETLKLLNIPAAPQSNILFYDPTPGSNIVTYGAAPTSFDPSADINFTGMDSFTGGFSVVAGTGDVTLTSTNGNVNVQAVTPGASASVQGDSVVIGALTDINVASDGTLELNAATGWSANSSSSIIMQSSDFMFFASTGSSVTMVSNTSSVSITGHTTLDLAATTGTLTLTTVSDAINVNSADNITLTSAAILTLNSNANLVTNAGDSYVANATHQYIVTTGTGNIVLTAAANVFLDSGTMVSLGASTATQVNVGNAATASTWVGTSFQIATTTSFVADAPSVEIANSAATSFVLGNSAASTTFNAADLSIVGNTFVDIDSPSEVRFGASDAVTVQIGNTGSAVTVNANTIQVASGVPTTTGTVAVPAHTPPAGFNYLVIDASGNIHQFAA